MTNRFDGTRMRVPVKERRAFRGVDVSQGMVLLDVDLNEQGAALLNRIEDETVDILGSKGKFVYPAGDTGFRITGSAPAANFDIGAGHGYLDGWLLENPAVCKLGTQPHPRTGDVVNPVAIIALKALVRHVDRVEEPALADVALGDAQASGRAVNDWQVFPLAMPVPAGGSLSCAEAALRVEWAHVIAPSTGTMTVIKQAAGPSSDPCSLTPGGGYTRLENRLYRVEVHGGVPKPGVLQADGPRYSGVGLIVKVQSRNASLMVRIVDIVGSEIKVEPAALDARHWFAPGAYAEIVNVHDDVDPRAALANERLFKVALATDDRIVLAAPAAAIAATLAAKDGNWFLRLWDAFPSGDGTAVVTGGASQVIDLGDGLSIRFQGGIGATYRRGDYWTFAARADGSIDWPETVPGTPVPMVPHGPETRYAVLAVAGGTAAAPAFDNCSIPFASLTDRLLFYRGGDGQSGFIPPPGPAMSPFVLLPQRLRVAVMRGERPVAGAVIRWTPPPAAPDSRVAGQPCTPGSAVVSITDANGLAEVDWEIDPARPLDLHRVQATLVTSPTTNLANTMLFHARFATAARTSYTPGRCKHLLNVFNVQEAIDALCQKVETRPPVMTLTEIKLLQPNGQPIELIRENLILNGLEIRNDAFVNGISFGFDLGMPTIAITPWDPVVEVELDLPYPSTDPDRAYWGLASRIPVPGAAPRQVRGPVGFQRLRLDGTVKLVPAQAGRQAGLLWQPSPEAQQFLQTATEHRFGQKFNQSALVSLRDAGFLAESAFRRILCRVHVRSAMIWVGNGANRAYLNAEHLGTRGPFTGRELDLRARDPQSAADLDFFLYLTPPNFSTDVSFPLDVNVLGNLHGIATRDLNLLTRDVALADGVVTPNS
ncbi:MAG TPA: DUF6519 domain-containing protein [Allosphingosinicella sp.]